MSKHPNVSVKILEEYQLRHAPKQSIGASRSRESKCISCEGC